MSQLELHLKSYDYYELMNLFKINNNDNRNVMMYKLDKKLEQINNGNFEEHIINFYKKAKNVIVVISDLISNNYIKESQVESFMNKIYNIDDNENIENLNAIDLINRIKNNDIARLIPLTNINEPYPNTNKLDYSLNNKNNTNTVFNVATNEVSPGDLNSIKRITQLLNLNINSCFRNNYYQSSPTDFLYNLPVEIKHVLSLRLVSIELPNAWYLFSSLKKNNIFYITVVEHKYKHKPAETNQYKIEIPDGNYSYETLESYLNTTYFCESEIDYPLKNIKFTIDPNSFKSIFSVINDDFDCNKTIFSIIFSLDINQNMMGTAGWILGFRYANYNDISKVVSEGLFDAGGDRYVYVSINDFQYNNNTSNIVCFDKSILNEDVIAKIPSVNGKLSLIIDNNNTDSLSKIRRYNGPITLTKMQIKILDQFGTVIDLNNMDFSMTLELQILYENFNFKNVTA